MVATVMELVMHGEGRGRKEFVEVTRSMGIVKVSVIKLARSSKIIRFFKSQPMRAPDDFRSVFKLCS